MTFLVGLLLGLIIGLPLGAILYALGAYLNVRDGRDLTYVDGHLKWVDRPQQ